MISQESPAVEMRITLKEGKGMRLNPKRDKFTILDNGVLIVEHGVHQVTYLAPTNWLDVQVIDQLTAKEENLRKYGPKPEEGGAN